MIFSIILSGLVYSSARQSSNQSRSIQWIATFADPDRTWIEKPMSFRLRYHNNSLRKQVPNVCRHLQPTNTKWGVCLIAHWGFLLTKKASRADQTHLPARIHLALPGSLKPFQILYPKVKDEYIPAIHF